MANNIKKQIKDLKNKARQHYQSYNATLNLYGCGKNLAENISSTVLHDKLEFNRIMDELALIDVEAPKFRL